MLVADLTRRYSNESLAKSPETFSTSLHFEMFFSHLRPGFWWVVDEFSHRSHHRWKCRTPCSSSMEVGIRQTKQGIEGRIGFIQEDGHLGDGNSNICFMFTSKNWGR